MSTEAADMELQSREDRRIDAWFRLLYNVIWPFFNVFRPIRVLGREHIPVGPAVVCPNHTTIGDPFYVVFAFGRTSPLRAMAKIQIMRIPFVGWILGKAGVFGVDRGHADMRAVKTAMKLLKDGNKLLMFPEGTRVHEGEDVAAKTGAAMFATRTGTPLLPVYVQTKKKLFSRNVVVIGRPFYPTFEGRKPTPDELDAITEDLMGRIRALGERQL
ncbi:MAG: lysophospholipid acyltransferase family protein [Lawsonibacter sp.]|nr:lysophospholipid acyltransferase family protein [Lawsonibacter sp.]